MPIWEIKDIQQNPHSKLLAPHPNALYSYEIGLRGNRNMTGSDFLYKEVLLLMNHLDVERPQDLVGRTFKNDATCAISAFNLLIIQAMHGGLYTPPLKEELYVRSAVAFSRMHLPDFSDVDDETVFKAFFPVCQNLKMDELWFKIFQETILYESKKLVRIEPARPGEFQSGIMGGAICLVLLKGTRRQRLTLGPYSRPFSFYY